MFAFVNEDDKKMVECSLKYCFVNTYYAIMYSQKGTIEESTISSFFEPFKMMEVP